MLYFLDKSKTTPLESAFAWAVKHRHSASFTPIASPDDRSQFDANFGLYAKLTQDGEWVRVWVKGAGGRPRKADDELSARSIQRIRKGEQR